MDRWFDSVTNILAISVLLVGSKKVWIWTALYNKEIWDKSNEIWTQEVWSANHSGTSNLIVKPKQLLQYLCELVDLLKQGQFQLK